MNGVLHHTLTNPHTRGGADDATRGLPFVWRRVSADKSQPRFTFTTRSRPAVEMMATAQTVEMKTSAAGCEMPPSVTMSSSNWEKIPASWDGETNATHDGGGAKSKCTPHRTHRGRRNKDFGALLGSRSNVVC